MQHPIITYEVGYTVLEEAAIKVLPISMARGELGHHYRKGWEPGNRVGKPQFEQPTQNLPEQASQGDLVPLRSGEVPYQGLKLEGSQ